MKAAMLDVMNRVATKAKNPPWLNMSPQTVMNAFAGAFIGNSAAAAIPMTMPGRKMRQGKSRKLRIEALTDLPSLATMTLCIAMGWMGQEMKTAITEKQR